MPLGNCPGCEVHSGFYASYSNLRDQMVSALNSIGAHSVIITGHSLGAALANLAAYDVVRALSVPRQMILCAVTHVVLLMSQSSIFDVVTFYTFGQPRVGNAAYASYFSKVASEYRVVHYMDIVPHLPPQALDFHHVGTEVSCCYILLAMRFLCCTAHHIRFSLVVHGLTSLSRWFCLT